MAEVNLSLDDKNHGAFYITEGEEKIGEMVISIKGNDLTAYHTEVSPKAEGKGYAKKLLQAMADHARTHGLKVIPLCPYVLAQFNRHREEYADIWKQESVQ